MKRIVCLILFVLVGCREGVVEPGPEAQIKLTRRPGNQVVVELVGAPVGARALQAVLTVEGDGTFVFEEAAAPQGLPLDTVRLAAAGRNRAILFSGDKRGVQLPAAGEVATFRLSGAAGSTGRLAVESVVLSSAEGTTIAISVGSALALSL